MQSALLGQTETVAQLKALYHRLDLPVSLAALQVDIHDEEQIKRLIERTLQAGESIHLLPLALNETTLRSALSYVESQTA
ncbi:putative oxidoreductase [compost metagenome]